MKKTMIAGIAAAVLVAGGAGYALADDRDDDLTRTSTAGGSPQQLPGDDDDRDELRGDALERASQAALEHTGGGHVTDAERSDDGDRHAYEVEVTMDDGTEYDLDLDADYAVVDVDRDDD